MHLGCVCDRGLGVGLAVGLPKTGAGRGSAASCHPCIFQHPYPSPISSPPTHICRCACSLRPCSLPSARWPPTCS